MKNIGVTKVISEPKLKACPFCGKSDIRLSIKTATLSDAKKAHHVAYYCWNCHAIGSRLLVREKNKYSIEANQDVKEKAAILWNRRA